MTSSTRSNIGSLMAERITVHAQPPYDVIIGRDLLPEIPRLLPGAERIAVVHAATPGAPSALAVRLERVLRSDGREITVLTVPQGEAAKSADVLQDCWRELGSAGFTRSDAVVSLGGGATTDLAGFVAATWARGIRIVHVPTTLLAMVDATVGGKTGINIAAGKNLVGAFHLPVAVICDMAALATLPPADISAGLAEVIKVGFTCDPTILDDVLAQPTSAMDPESGLLLELIRRAVSVKAAVTVDDFRETAGTSASRSLGREVLNYGHTFGHAVELLEDYRWRHGDAVSVGMVYVAELAGLAGELDPEVIALHRTVLEAVNLPTTYPAGHWPALLAGMRVDKKARGSTLRFVVLDDIAQPRILANPDTLVLEEAYRRIAAG